MQTWCFYDPFALKCQVKLFKVKFEPKNFTEEEMIEEFRKIIGNMKSNSINEISNEKLKKIIKILED